MGAPHPLRTIFAAPGRYIQGPGVLRHAGELVRPYGGSVHVIAGTTAYQKAGRTLERSLAAAELQILEVSRGVPECTEELIRSLASAIERSGAELVLAVGGGRVADTAKGAAYLAKREIICIPTQAATNADGSGESVLYDADHRPAGEWQYPRNPAAVLVDTALLARAPSKLLAYGMGDALSAKVEGAAVLASGSPNPLGGLASHAGLQLATLAYETLLSWGSAALAANRRRRPSEPFERVVEAIKLHSCIGFESTGCAAAHAIQGGVSRVLGDVRHHGELVAFGTFVQLHLERTPARELRRVGRWLRAVGLPRTLAEVGIEDSRTARAIAKNACHPHETMAKMPFRVTPAMVERAMGAADRLGRAV